MESVASACNLAQALLNVFGNKGAPGVDDQTVEEVVEAAPSLLPKLQTALLQGTYQPGDIRRVWIEKPGSGQRGLGMWWTAGFNRPPCKYWSRSLNQPSIPAKPNRSRKA